MSASPCPVVAIDGPSGSGKGTISRAVARRVSWHLLDSGALYRLVALAGATSALAPDDVAGHAALARARHGAHGSATVLRTGHGHPARG